MSSFVSKAFPDTADMAGPKVVGLKVIPPVAGSVDVVNTWVSSLKMILVLFKFRVVVLLLFAAVGGAFLGAGGWPGGGTLALLLITGGLAASGASAINQYLEQDSDGLMSRTRHRPLVTNSIKRPGWVPYVSILMILVPSLAVLPFNPALTFFLLLGAVIYVGVYTIWLKPRTTLNIVIGGAAGSAAVLSGSAAVGEWDNMAAVLLALLLFVWTPTHFWSLAVVYRKDYARSGTPMLPTKISIRQSALWIMLHTVVTVFAALALVVHPALGWLYIIPVGIATVDFLIRNIKLVIWPTEKAALSVFMASNIYLFLVLLMACVDTLI